MLSLQSSGRADKFCGTAQQIVGKMMGGGDLVIKGAARKESGIAEIAAAKANKEAKKHGESGDSAAHDGNKAAGAGKLHAQPLLLASYKQATHS
jgi:uncharacterized protein YjbJ (UPF0337 family)